MKDIKSQGWISLGVVSGNPNCGAVVEKKEEGYEYHNLGACNVHSPQEHTELIRKAKGFLVG